MFFSEIIIYKMFSYFQKQNKAFTLLEIAVYLSLFAAIVLVIYPTIDNLIGYLNSWQTYETVLSDFRRISAELQTKALEAKNIGPLTSPPGIYFIIQNSTTSYYASSGAIYRQTSTETLILTSTGTVATWTVENKENVFVISFYLKDKFERVFLNATTSLGKLLP